MGYNKWYDTKIEDQWVGNIGVDFYREVVLVGETVIYTTGLVKWICITNDQGRMGKLSIDMLYRTHNRNNLVTVR